MKAPQVYFQNRYLGAICLAAESYSQGWRQTEYGNAVILTQCHTLGTNTGGPTITLNCGSYDPGSQVAATLTNEAPDPNVTVATAQIIDDGIAAAFNDAINQVFALMQHYYPD